MAYCRLGHIKESKSGNPSAGLYNCLDYIFNPKKTQDNTYIGGYNLYVMPGSDDCAASAYHAMLSTKESFSKITGRQGYHYKLSFAPNDDVTPELAMTITDEFCSRCFVDYECAYAVHDNTEHLHSHIVFNSVDLVQGYKYHYENGDWKNRIMPIANSICQKYGLSQLDLNLDEELRLRHKNHSYGKWKNENRKPKGRTSVYPNSMIRADVDACIRQAKSYNEFLILMGERGHVIDDTGKHMTILAPGRSRPCRSYILSEDKQTYTRDNIIKMINGTYISRDEIRKRMFADWERYAGEPVYIAVSRVRPALAQMIEARDMQRQHALNNREDIAVYKEYLEQVDKELNILRKYVNQSMDSRQEALDVLARLLPLLPSAKKYAEGNKMYEAQYIQASELYLKLKGHGYSMAALYHYQAAGERMLQEIQNYKKHIYVERKVLDRLEKTVGNAGKTNVEIR